MGPDIDELATDDLELEDLEDDELDVTLVEPLDTLELNVLDELTEVTLLESELSGASLEETSELSGGFALKTSGWPPHADKVSSSAPTITVAKGSLVIPIIA